MKNRFLPMNLQFFAEPDGGGAAGGTEPPAGVQQPTGTTNIDYDKLASLIQGKQSVAEDTVLKSYFKNQGLSQEEMTQAIAAFKQQKAESQPNVEAIQSQAAQAQAAARQAMLEKEATLQALTLGIDVKNLPHVLKLADMSTAIGEDGKVKEEELKNALNKVLEDIPAFKAASNGGSGFQQIGAGGGQGNGGGDDSDLARAFGNS